MRLLQRQVIALGKLGRLFRGIFATGMPHVLPKRLKMEAKTTETMEQAQSSSTVSSLRVFKPDRCGGEVTLPPLALLRSWLALFCPELDLPCLLRGVPDGRECVNQSRKLSSSDGLVRWAHRCSYGRKKLIRWGMDLHPWAENSRSSLGTYSMALATSSSVSSSGSSPRAM